MSRPHCQNRDACTASRPTRHCRACMNAHINSDPEIAARRLAGIAAKFADPDKRAAHIAVAKRNIASMHAQPERMRERGRQLQPFSQTPEALAARRARDAEAGAKRSATVLAWCPPELRDQYRALVKKGVPAPEARAAIEADLPSHGRRIVARNAAAMRAKHEREKAQAY